MGVYIYIYIPVCVCVYIYEYVCVCVCVLGSNPGLLHNRQIVYQLSGKGSMYIYICISVYIYTQEMISNWRCIIRHRNQDNALSKKNGLQ